MSEYILIQLLFSLGVWILLALVCPCLVSVSMLFNSNTRHSEWIQSMQKSSATARTGRGNVWNAAYISTFRLGDTFLVTLREVEVGRADLPRGVEAPQHAHADHFWEWVEGRDVALHRRCAVRAHHFRGPVGFHCCQRDGGGQKQLESTEVFF